MKKHSKNTTEKKIRQQNRNQKYDMGKILQGLVKPIKEITEDLDNYSRPTIVLRRSADQR